MPVAIALAKAFFRPEGMLTNFASMQTNSLGQIVRFRWVAILYESKNDGKWRTRTTEFCSNPYDFGNNIRPNIDISDAFSMHEVRTIERNILSDLT